MIRVELSEKEAFCTKGHTSKGNQVKWKENDYWVKGDYAGYEGLSESVVCYSLGLIDSEAVSDIINYAQYETSQIVLGSEELLGCISHEFLCDRKKIIQLQKLYRAFTGDNLVKDLARMNDIKNKVEYTVDFVKKITGLNEFGKYLTFTMELDALFLNEDRHMNNIAVIYDKNKDEYEYCPIFDNGMSLLSDIKEDYPLGKGDVFTETLGYISCVKAKPFSESFDEQLDAANELYGNFLKFRVTRNEYLNMVEKFISEECRLYPKGIKERVMIVLRQQTRKYVYMFK